MYIAPYTQSIYTYIAPIYTINIHDIHFKDNNYNDHVFTLIISNKQCECINFSLSSNVKHDNLRG